MKLSKKIVLVLVSLFSLSACNSSDVSLNKNLDHKPEVQGVIYGQDSRFEASQKYSKVTAAMAIFFSNSRLTVANSGYYFLKTETFKKAAHLCPGERFENQPLFGSCSGALVGPDLVLTAGHCMSGPNVCSDYSVTFGWDVEKAKTGILSKADIYRCTKILKIKDDPYNGYDYALVKLDRPVKATPLKISKKINTKFLLSASYPHGLPLKYDIATDFEPYSPTMFKVKVDTSQSSSGSPLIDADGNVVGVLSMGNMDYTDELNLPSGPCRRLRVCKGNECTGQIYDNLKDLNL